MVPMLTNSNISLSVAPDGLTSRVSRNSLLKAEESTGAPAAADSKVVDGIKTGTQDSGRLSRWSSLMHRFSIGTNSNNNNSITRRRVRFSKEKPEVYVTFAREDFSDKEFVSYWIQPKEMKRTHDRCWDIVDAYKMAKVNGKTCQFCTRGLESYILERRRGEEVYRIKRENAYFAVLVWGKGLSAEERSRRYQTVSRRCMVRATEYARRDALSAKQIYEDESSERSKRQRSGPVPSLLEQICTQKQAGFEMQGSQKRKPQPSNTLFAPTQISRNDSARARKSSSLRDLSKGDRGSQSEPLGPTRRLRSESPPQRQRFAETLLRSSRTGCISKGKPRIGRGAETWRPGPRTYIRSHSPSRRQRSLGIGRVLNQTQCFGTSSDMHVSPSRVIRNPEQFTNEG